MRLTPALPVLLLALMAAAWPLHAQPPADSPPLADWQSLTPAQRATLVAPLRTRWDEASAQERARMWRHAHRWQHLTPEQRRDARKGARRWEHMPPHKRERALRLFHHTRGMTEAQKHAFLQQWRTMTPDQRKAWLERHPPAPPPARADQSAPATGGRGG